MKEYTHKRTSQCKILQVLVQVIHIVFHWVGAVPLRTVCYYAIEFGKVQVVKMTKNKVYQGFLCIL